MKSNSLHKNIPPVLLLLCLALSIIIRICNVSNLEGKLLIGTDSARFVRQAKLILKNGHLPQRDRMRSFPVGRVIDNPLFFPYLLAWLYKFFSFFIPHLTLEQFSIFYPVMFSALACFVFYLLVKQLLDRNVALLAVNIAAVSPILVFRTMAGYADHDALCLFLSFSAYYFYVRSYKSKKKRLLFAFASGAVMAVLGLTWQGFFIFTLVIVGTELTRFLLSGYRKSDFYAYLLWVIPIFISMLGSKRTYHNISDPSVFLAILIPSFILFIAPINFFASKISLIAKQKTLFILAVGAGVLILGLVILTISTSLSPWCMFVEIWERINYPFRRNRLTKFIGELKKETLWDWYIWPGLLFLGILGGSLILLFRVAKNLRINAWIAASFFEICVIGIIFSRILSGGYVSEDTPVTNVIYMISLAGLLLFLFGISILLESKESCQYKIDQDAIFLLVYFIIMLLLARSAIRFKFFLAPIEIILGTLAIVWLLQRLVKNEQLDKVVYFLASAMIIWEFFAIQDVLFSNLPQNISFGVALVLTLILSIFVIDHRKVWIQIKQFRLSILKDGLIWGTLAVVLFIPTPLKLGIVSVYVRVSSEIVMMKKPSVAKMLPALTWLREKSPQKSVIAASWEYGSRINLISEKATIVDEAQTNNPYWIYLMSRHVMVGKTEREALAFLKAHGATHLLLTARDISIIPKVSYIGSDESLDRKISLPCFGLTVERVESDAGTVVYRYRTPEIVYTDDLQSKKSYKIVGIYLQVGGRNQDLAAVTIELRCEKDIQRVPPEEIYFRGNLIQQQKKNSLPCTILINAETDNPFDWSIIYLSKAARNSLAVQLYLLDKESEFFTPVYPPSSLKRSNYYARIWKISYPKGLAVNPEYLKMKFSDPKLIRAWKETKR